MSDIEEDYFTLRNAIVELSGLVDFDIESINPDADETYLMSEFLNYLGQELVKHGVTYKTTDEGESFHIGIEHWTAHHICLENGEYVAYDEAQLEHSRHPTHDQARDALVIYAHQIKPDSRACCPALGGFTK